MILRVLNVTALVAGLLGLVFRIQRWAGADALLGLGFGALLASTLLFTVADTTAAGTVRPLAYLLVATLGGAMLSTLAKLMRWPGVVPLGLLTLMLAVTLSGVLVASRQPVGGSRQLLTVLFVFLTLFFATLLLPGL